MLPMKARARLLTVETTPTAAARQGGSPVVSKRLAQLEAEVAAGTRDARSLSVFSRAFVEKVAVTFPVDAFGPAKPW
jgi:hypothetical protein